MSTVYIGMGSNLGDGKANLLGARERLGEEDGVTLGQLSSPYMTAPVDMTSQHWFTNSVGRFETRLNPLEVLRLLLLVEHEFGRMRKQKAFGYQDRSLDLDLLYYDDLVMDSTELILPHPRIGDRLFVLVPLTEIAPDHVDAKSGRTVTVLEADLRRTLEKENVRNQEIVRGSWDRDGSS